MIHKTLHRKQKISENRDDALERSAIPAPIVTSVILLMIKIWL
jgi:hypothetical protein